MQEVSIRIRFNQVCPGSVRKKAGNNVLHAHHRDPEGNILFLPSWWSALVRYAAKVLNRHQTSVKKIRWDPVVDGVPRKWKRYLPAPPGKPTARQKYALHEAFLSGSVIGINCVLPRDISLDDLWQLLDIAGTYKGISPYKPNEGYGTFKVVSIRKRKRSIDKETGDIDGTARIAASEVRSDDRLGDG